MKLKSFCTAKETINETRQPSEWEKYLQTKQLTKDQSPKYTISSCSSTSKEQPNPKMGRRAKQTFLQRRYTDCQQTHERILNIINH